MVLSVVVSVGPEIQQEWTQLVGPSFLLCVFFLSWKEMTPEALGAS